MDVINYETCCTVHNPEENIVQLTVGQTYYEVTFIQVLLVHRTLFCKYVQIITTIAQNYKKLFTT